MPIYCWYYIDTHAIATQMCLEDQVRLSTSRTYLPAKRRASHFSNQTRSFVPANPPDSMRIYAYGTLETG